VGLRSAALEEHPGYRSVRLEDRHAGA